MRVRDAADFSLRIRILTRLPAACLCLKIFAARRPHRHRRGAPEDRRRAGRFGRSQSLSAGAPPLLEVDAEAREGVSALVAAKLSLTADADRADLVVTAGTGTVKLHLTPGDSGDRTLSGDWTLDRSVVAPWLNRPLADFSTKGSFRIGFNPVTRALAATVSASGASVGPLFGAAAPEGFAMETSFSGRLDDMTFRIPDLHMEITSAAAQKAVVLDATALEISRGELVRGAGGRASSGSLKLTGAPLAWLNPILERSGFACASGDVSGKLDLVCDNAGNLTVDSGEGLKFSPAALTRDGKPWLPRLTLEFPVRVTRGADGAFLATGSKVALRHSGAEVATTDFSWKSDVAGAGELEASATVSPGALPEDFLPGGACKFCAETGLTLSATTRIGRSAAGALTVSSAKIEAVTRECVRALAVTLARPLDPAAVPADGAPLANFAFKGAPLSLFNPLFGGPLLGGVAEAGDLEISKTASCWKVARPASGAPAFVRGLSWTDASGATRLAPTDLRGSLGWERTPAGWKLSLDDTTFTNAAGCALAGRATLSGGACLSSLDADVSCSVPALAASLPDLRKPAFVTGDFTLKARRSGKGDASLDLGIQNLTTVSGAKPCGLTLRATTSEEGGVRVFSAPAVLSGPSGETKFALDGTLRETVAGKDWNVSLTGGTLFADDWNALFPPSGVSGGAPQAAPAPSVRAAVPTTPDTDPFWTGDTGRFSVALDAVKFAGETVDKPAAVVVVTPERLATESLAARWRGLPVRGDATLAFKSGDPKPYALSARCDVEKLPLGAVVGTFAPNASGWIDGDFDVALAASGTAANAGALASGTTLDVSLKSRDGTLKFFRADNEVVRLSGEIAGVAGDLAGDLGRMLGKSAPAGQSGLLSAASVLQKALVSVKTSKPGPGPEAHAGRRAGDDFRRLVQRCAAPARPRRLRPGRRHGVPRPQRDRRRAPRRQGRHRRGASRPWPAADKPDDAGWLAGPEPRHEGPLNNLQNNLLNNLSWPSPRRRHCCRSRSSSPPTRLPTP